MPVLDSLFLSPIECLRFFVCLFLRCFNITAAYDRPMKLKEKSLTVEYCLSFALYSLAYALSKNVAEHCC